MTMFITLLVRDFCDINIILINNVSSHKSSVQYKKNNCFLQIISNLVSFIVCDDWWSEGGQQNQWNQNNNNRWDQNNGQWNQQGNQQNGRWDSWNNNRWSNNQWNSANGDRQNQWNRNEQRMMRQCNDQIREYWKCVNLENLKFSNRRYMSEAMNNQLNREVYECFDE